MMSKSFGVASTLLLSCCLAQAQISAVGKGYVFRVTFTPKQVATYQVTHRMVGQNIRVVPSTVRVTCTEIKQGFFNVEVDEQVDEQADTVSQDPPIYQKSWVNDRGHSAHKLPFWFSTCPYGPVKMKSRWRGNPPLLAEREGAPASAPFVYTLTGFEIKDGRKAARLGFSYVNAPTYHHKTETSYAGGMLIDSSNGQLLDFTLSRTDRLPAEATSKGSQSKPLVSTSVTRLVRV